MAVTDLYLAKNIPGSANGAVIADGGISMRELPGGEGSEDIDGTAKASRRWLVTGSDDPRTCRAALLANVSLNIYDGMQRKSLSWTRNDFEVFTFTVSYSTKAPSNGNVTVSIDTTGGTILQTYAYDQASFPAESQTASDFGNSIDVQDGKPQGVQRIIPALKLNVRAVIATEYLGASPFDYAVKVARLTGTYNNTPLFNGRFAAGELLFAGATGEIVSENPQLDFTFLASANQQGLTIGDIANINKLGHDYLWFSYYEDKDTTTKLRVAKPRAAYVSRVYGPADHNSLYIGVPGSDS